MKPFLIIALLLSSLPASAQRNALSPSDRMWVEMEMDKHRFLQQSNDWYRQRDANRAAFTGAVVTGVIGGLMNMAAEAEQRKNMQSFYNQQAEAMRRIEEKPRLMAWAVGYRAQMRQNHEPEWKITHNLRAQGVDPAEVDFWEAAFRVTAASSAAAATAPTTASGGGDPALLQRIAELERRAADAERKLQAVNTLPAATDAEKQKDAELMALRRNGAEALAYKWIEPHLSDTARAKRIRALGFDPVTLKPLEDSGASLAGR